MNTEPLHPVILVFALALATAVTGPAAGQGTRMDMSGADGMRMDSPGPDGMGMMDDVDTSSIPRVPPVAGYADGTRIFFVHTEVSDPQIGSLMTEMMGSPVPVVPALAGVPESVLANVWVFTNGVKPEGPRGPLDFQPDVFDRPAGAEGYSPLRVLNLVTWKDGAEPRLLQSAAEVNAALESGEVSIERTDVVANMPFLTWPGGHR